MSFIAEHSSPSAFPPVIAGPKPSLLSLPLEIRLTIYEALLWVCPIPLAPDLAPGYPTPSPRTCVHSPLDASSSVVLMSAHRPLGCIPTSFLLSCRQIYHESRATPFRQNEFVFQAFFSSGVVPAGVLVKRLAQWQREELRWVRIDVQGGDWGFRKDSAAKWWRAGSDGGASTWKAVCEGLKGVKGLRTRVSMNGIKVTAGWIGERGGGDDNDGKSSEFENAYWRWVDEGLKGMKELRWLEIEVAVGGGEDEEKVEWCRRIEGRLNKGRRDGEKKVTVVAVCQLYKGKDKSA